LDKAYDPNAPEDDMKERAEESERMREHVLKETDKNKDRLISLEEFLTQTKEEDFNNHETWEGLDDEEQPEYSDQEFQQFEAQRNAEIQAMIAQGLVPPGYPYYGDVPPGAIPNPGVVPPPNGIHPQYQGHPGVQGQQVYHPNIQQGQPHQGAVPVNAYNPNQPASNINAGSNVQAGQPIMPNPPVSGNNQYNPPKPNNIPGNPQAPQGQMNTGGAVLGGQFQQVNQGQQFSGNMQPAQQNQPSQYNPQVRQNPPPNFQNPPPVQQGQPQKGNMNSQGQHTP
jgi:hypothetical protein